MQLRLNILIMILGCLFTLPAISQEATLFVRFQNSAKLNTAKVTPAEDGYAVLNYNYNYNGVQPFYSLIITNDKGNPESQLDTIKLEGIQVEHIEGMQYHQAHFIFYANVILNDHSDAFISFKLNEDLNEVSIIDTIFLLKNHNLDFRSDFKYNETSGSIENFGVDFDEGQGVGTGTVYLSVNAEGVFINYHILDLPDFPTYVMDFIGLPDESQYALTLWNRTTILLDENFQLISYGENTFSYAIGDTTYNTIYTFYSCFYANGKLWCAGSGGPENELNYALAEMRDSNGVLFISNLNPLLPQGTREDIVTSMMTSDMEGNQIGLAVSYFLPVGHTVTENKLYITKINQNQEVEWVQIFTTSGELAPLDFLADLNGDLINVGAFQSTNTPEIIEGYFLKVFEDGSLINAIQPNAKEPEKFNVFPNPVNEFLYLETHEIKDVYIDVYSADGRQAMQRIRTTTNQVINLGQLQLGWYYLRITDEGTGAFQSFSIFKE